MELGIVNLGLGLKGKNYELGTENQELGIKSFTIKSWNIACSQGGNQPQHAGQLGWEVSFN